MSHNDIEALKRLASGRWHEILSRLGGCPSDILDGRHHACPKRCAPDGGGRDRFRMIDEAAGAVLCNQCGKNIGDGIASLQWLNGWTFNEATAKLAEYLGSDPPKMAGGKKSKGAEDGAVYASVRAALQPTLVALAEKHREANQDERPRVVRVDRYETFAVYRIDLPTPPGEKRRKEFRPVHAIELGDGRKAYKLGYPPGRRPLFRRVDLLAVAEPSMVVVVGGEKAAEAAAGMGLVATTCAGGEKAVRETDWAPLSRFARVVVSIDNDPAGHEYGALVSAAIKALSPAPAVRILLLPDLPPKGDIVEWIAAGGTREKFLELANSAPPPDPIAHDRAICEAIQIDVLGELPGGAIKVFSGQLGKTVEVKRPVWLAYSDLLQMFGPIVREKISNAKDAPPGMTSVQRVQEAIAVVGGSERAGQGVEKGLGVWPGDDGQIVLVGPGRACVWTGAGLETFRRPRVAGIKVDLDHPAESKWFCPDVLEQHLIAAGDRDWCLQTVQRFCDIVSQWNWKTPSGAEATTCELLAGLVMATWVQSCWSWRPMVGIAAASDSGKSTLFEVLETIFGPLALLNSKSSEAGIRQAVAGHSKAILCDEFENDNHRQKILEYFRTASRGSRTLRGTTSQRGQEFGLQHICWVTAVELGLRRAPDRNRFIMLDLDPPPRDRRGKLLLPPTAELRDLGQRLLAVAVRYVWKAEEIAGRIKSTPVEGIHGRVVESFATPVGMLAAVTGMDVAAQGRLLEAVIGGVDTDPMQSTRDETDLLADIIGTMVDLGRGEKATVAQILDRPADYPTGWDALERHGIAPVTETRGASSRDRAREYETERAGLFIDPKPVLRLLLRGTPWDGQDIAQILKRLPGAARDQRAVGGHRPRGIVIPWRLVREKFLANENSGNTF